MNFRSFKLGTRLYGGFALVGLVLIATVSTTFWNVKKSEASTSRVIDLRAPTAKLGVELLNGLNYSLASLRGYMLLDAAQFKVVRQDACDEQINPVLETMSRLSKDWTVQANQDRLAGIVDQQVVYRPGQAGTP